MAHQVENFSIHAGNDIQIPVVVEDENNGSLTDATIHWWAARSRFTTADKVTLKKSTEDGIEITDADAREFTLTLTRADTLDLLGGYHHEFMIIDNEGNHSTVIDGTMTIERSLVRPEDEVEEE